MTDSNRALHRRHWVAPGALLLLASLAGCSQFQPYQRPEVALPGAWAGASPAGTATATAATATATVDTGAVTAKPSAGAAPAAAAAAPLAWQDWVRDPALKVLVEQALARNRDARVAALQVEQLRAQYRIRDAAQWPVVGVGMTNSRQTVGENEPIKSALTAGLQVSGWELDLFGRVQSLKEVALAQYLATQETQRSVHTSLVAGVVSGWLNIQANHALLDLTRQTLAGREETLRLTQLRFEHGSASALEVQTAESLAASAQATLAQQQRQLALEQNALALLVGQPVDQAWAGVAANPAVQAVAPANAATSAATVASPNQGDALSAVLAEVPVGLPSSVLLQRPDIRAAEQQLAAASAQVGAARAAFFPRVTLTASLGSASSELSGLFKSGTWGWAVAPQALVPIFDAGANQAGLDSAQAGRELALAQYEKAIQVAFKEVNDALGSQGSLDAQWQAQQRVAKAEAERLRLSELRLAQGVASQLEVLDAQRSVFAARQALVQTRFARSLNRVALFKATAGI